MNLLVSSVQKKDILQRYVIIVVKVKVKVVVKVIVEIVEVKVIAKNMIVERSNPLWLALVKWV